MYIYQRVIVALSGSGLSFTSEELQHLLRRSLYATTGQSQAQDIPLTKATLQLANAGQDDPSPVTY